MADCWEPVLELLKGKPDRCFPNTLLIAATAAASWRTLPHTHVRYPQPRLCTAHPLPCRLGGTLLLLLPLPLAATVSHRACHSGHMHGPMYKNYLRTKHCAANLRVSDITNVFPLQGGRT